MAKVAGKIYDKRTKLPIPFIGVVLGEKGKATNTQGYFEFKDPPLPLVLKIRAPFYQPVESRISEFTENLHIDLMPAHAI